MIYRQQKHIYLYQFNVIYTNKAKMKYYLVNIFISMKSLENFKHFWVCHRGIEYCSSRNADNHYSCL